jgi:hypothetical protein
VNALISELNIPHSGRDGGVQGVRRRILETRLYFLFTGSSLSFTQDNES